MTEALNAGTLEIQLLADVARLRTDMQQATGIVTRGADQMRAAAQAAQNALGAIGVGMSAGAFVAFVKSAIDTLDTLDDLAEKTGIAAGELAALRYAGEVAGTPLESLAKGVQKLSINMVAAAGGAKEQGALFDLLGVKVKNLDGSVRSSDDVLGDLADRFASFRDGPEKAALAVELFGKSGAEMIPFLNKGSAGIKDLRQEAERLGVSMSGDLAKQAGDFNDNLKRLKLAGEAFGMDIARVTLPTLNALAEAMLGTGNAARQAEPAVTALMGALAGAGIAGGLAGTAVAVRTVSGALGTLAGVIAANPALAILLGVGSVAGAGVGIAKAYSRTESGVLAAIDQLEQENARSEEALKRATEAGRGYGANNIAAKINERREQIKELRGELAMLNAAYIGKDNDSDAVSRMMARPKDKSAAPTLDKSGPAKESDYDRLIKKINGELSQAYAEAEAAANAYNKAQTDFLALAKSPLWAELTGKERARVASLFEQRIAAEQVKATEEASLKSATATAEARQAAAIKEADAIAAAMREQQAAYASSLASVLDRTQGLKDEAAAAAISAGGHTTLAEAVEQVTIARLQEKQAGFVQGSEGWLAIEREIEARRNLIQWIRSGEARKANEQAAKDAAAEWQKTSDQIGQSLTDALMNGGKSGAEYIQSLFRTMVLRPVVQYGVNSLLGAIGMAPTPASGAMGALGGIGQLGSLATSFPGVASALGLGGLAGTGIASNVGIGTSIGLSTAEATAAANAAGAAAAGSGIGGALMSAAPYLAALAVVSSLFEDNSGTYHTGAASTYSAATGLKNPTVDATGWFGDVPGMARAVYSADTAATTDTLVKSIAGVLDATATTFGKTAGYSVSAAMADDVSEDGSWWSLSISKMGESLVDWADTQTSRWAPREFADGAAGQAQAMAAVASSLRDVLDGMDLPGWASGMLDALGNAPTLETLSATLTQIQGVHTALARMADVMPQLATLTDATTTSLLGLMGGADGLAAVADQYYQRFYSEQERMDTLSRQLSDTLASVGLSTPSTLEDFRALVEAQDLATATGASTYATLLKSADAFYTLDQYAARQTDATLTAASAAAKQADALDAVTRSTREAIDAMLEQARVQAATRLDYQRSLVDLRDRTALGAAQQAAWAASVAAMPVETSQQAASAAAYTPAATVATTADTSAAVVTAVNALRTDLSGQLSDMRAELRAVATATQQTQRLLDRVIQDKDAMRTTSV